MTEISHNPDDRLQADCMLDVSGLACPMPLLKAKQRLNGMEVGQTLCVIATDAGSQRDFVSYTRLSSHELLQTRIDGDRFMYLIRKGG